ncbi:MAG: hypothetical protein JW797_07615 [Bradymonadales bacterium]|nr:hypothetical protein [Bradymonadales bacterium]
MLWLPLLAMVFASTGACSGDDTNPVERRLGLRVFNANPDQPEGFSPGLAGSIQTVRVRVFQNDLEQRSTTFNWDEPAGRLPQLRYGSNYQIVVEAIGLQEGILADGATPRFDYYQDSPFSEIHVFTSQPDSVEYATAMYKPTGEDRVIALPTEFEGSFIARSLRLNGEAFGGQRAGHTLTTLSDGRLVVIGGARLVSSGGIDGSPFARFIGTVEIYDPYTGYWSLLRDSEKDPLLVPPPDPLPEGYQDVYIPAPLELSVARAFHTATLIGANRIMVVGGFFDDNGRIRATGAAEIIDIDTGTVDVMTPGYADLYYPRALHSAHWIGNQLVVVGGVSDLFDVPDFPGKIEAFQPSRGLFDFLADPNNEAQDLQLYIPRALHSGTTIGDGIVVAGGRTSSGVTDTIEFLEFRNGVLSNAIPNEALPHMSTPRFAHAAVYMERDYPTGEVTDRYIALAGGFTALHPSGDIAMTLLSGAQLTGTVEFFHTWYLEIAHEHQVSMIVPRAHFQMVETSTTKDLLVMGGITDNGSATNSIERLWRSEQGGLPLTPVAFPASLKHDRAYSATTVLPTHSVMIVGGWDGANSTASCGEGSGFTTGCTSEVANPGDLSFLGRSY